jgi:hypothetical protein
VGGVIVMGKLVGVGVPTGRAGVGGAERDDPQACCKSKLRPIASRVSLKEMMDSWETPDAWARGEVGTRLVWMAACALMVPFFVAPQPACCSSLRES